LNSGNSQLLENCFLLVDVFGYFFFLSYDIGSSLREYVNCFGLSLEIVTLLMPRLYDFCCQKPKGRRMARARFLAFLMLVGSAIEGPWICLHYVVWMIYSIITTMIRFLYDLPLNVWRWCKFFWVEMKESARDGMSALRALDRESVREWYHDTSQRRIFELAYEATQVLGSLLDVGLDIAVCIRFYSAERYLLFNVSVLVFALAQVAYAFCFMGIYTRDATDVKAQIKCFLTALPFSQFVPLFIWLESFHFVKVERMLVYFQLSPTELIQNQDATPKQKDPGAYVRFSERLLLSNCGFLV